MDPRGLRSPVGHGDADEQILRARLGVLGEHIEVAAPVEDAGVGELELGHIPAPALVLLHEPGVGELGLGVLVEGLQVRVGRRGIEVEVLLLHILAVVALWPGEPEEALLEEGILLVPEGQGEAQPALPVGDAHEPVLAPAVGAAPGVFVGKVRPARPIVGVVLADGAPLALGEIGTPPLPVVRAALILCEPACLGAQPTLWR
jgi:hypothetical protein